MAWEYIVEVIDTDEDLCEGDNPVELYCGPDRIKIMAILEQRLFPLFYGEEIHIKRVKPPPPVEE